MSNAVVMVMVKAMGEEKQHLREPRLEWTQITIVARVLNNLRVVNEHPSELLTNSSLHSTMVYSDLSKSMIGL